jgi:hypothetical protein
MEREEKSRMNLRRLGIRRLGQTELAKDLVTLAQKHGMAGCVLIAFGTNGDPRNLDVATCGKTDKFADAMESLGDRLAIAINAGQFNPTEAA